VEDEVGSDGALDTAGPPAVDPAPPKAKDVDLGSPAAEAAPPVDALLVEPPNLKISVEADDV